ncbi:MAG: hypothetical protein OXE77_12095 [Flavobacteriaceae bacterium]|nr:hypothetical protein [Flavobacteriaceae bacterium]MCY4267364.1 hypothetical protein [Flavobacteriaceae bacterium]MCY4299159.1 hypothetical protein [Flavobacteriaceae bacterium]
MKLDFQALVDSNPNQCSLKEYEYIGRLIKEYSPGNVLVFGAGRDGPYWIKINHGGQTWFFENDRRWIRKVRKMNPDILIEKVKYTTKRREWKKIIDNPQKLTIKLPNIAYQLNWDVIFIDAPRGNKDKRPGRMQSVYTASKLKYKHILLHDCDREVEREYFLKYIGKPSHIVDKLYHKVAH